MTDNVNNWPALERWLVILIALHSLIVGVILLFTPEWILDFGGWDEAAESFFVRQGGAFHIVVAAGYLIEYFRHRTINLLLVAKSVAVVFLFGMVLTGEGTLAVVLSALGDGAMLVVTWYAHRQSVKVKV